MATDEDALANLASVSNMSAPHNIRNYLYFETEESARSVAAWLQEAGFLIEMGRSADKVKWLVRATIQLIPTPSAIADMRTALEHVADAQAGEYDGWEAGVAR